MDLPAATVVSFSAAVNALTCNFFLALIIRGILLGTTDIPK